MRFRDATRELRAQTTIVYGLRTARPFGDVNVDPSCIGQLDLCSEFWMKFKCFNDRKTARDHYTKIRRVCSLIYNRDSDRLRVYGAQFVLRTEFFGKILNRQTPVSIFIIFIFFVFWLIKKSGFHNIAATCMVVCRVRVITTYFSLSKARLRETNDENVVWTLMVFTDGRMKLISRDSFRVCRQY